MKTRPFVNLMIICAVLFITAQILEASGTSEYEIKAAFIYNFAKFVTWPDKAFNNSDSPIVIGVIGDDPFDGKLDDAVKNKSANGRKLVVKRFKGINEIVDCQILFVCSSERKKLGDILDKTAGKNILTIGDMKNFAQDGGVFALKLERQTVAIEVNLSAAKKAGIQISSKLLKVAEVVKED